MGILGSGVMHQDRNNSDMNIVMSYCDHRQSYATCEWIQLSGTQEHVKSVSWSHSIHGKKVKRPDKLTSIDGSKITDKHG